MILPYSVGLGQIPDPPSRLVEETGEWKEHEDLSANAAMPRAWYGNDATPDKWTGNSALVPDVLNQGSLGSCTAQAVAQVLRAARTAQLMGVDGHERVPLASRLFMYYLARSTHGAAEADTGSWIRAIFEVVNRFGYPDEEAWPYDDRVFPEEGAPPYNGMRPAKFARMPSHKAFQAAFDRRSAAPENKLVEYRRIYETGSARVDAYKRLSSQGYLIAFGTKVSHDFCDKEWDGKPIDPPTKESDQRGGHALVGEGYTPKGPRILNSWSHLFGDNGRCDFTWDYLAWEKTDDLWIAKNVSEAT